MVSIKWGCRLVPFFSCAALLVGALFWILISQVLERRIMEEQRKQFSEDCMDRARELDSENGSETERPGDCGVRGHKRNEVQASISKVQRREKQLPRGRDTELEAFRKSSWDSETLKKLPVEGPGEMQGKTSPMMLIDLNKEPPRPLFAEGSFIAGLRKDTPQSFFGERSFIAAHYAAKDSRDLDERDLWKRNPKPQQQPHEAGALLFGPGSLVASTRSGINCIESTKPAMDENVLREIRLNMLGGDERPGVRHEEVEATEHREEGVDRGVNKENLDLLCYFAAIIGSAERPRHKVDVKTHREDGGDFYGAREENVSEMTETDRRIDSENLSLHKGSGTPPAKPNSEAVGLTPVEEAAREDVKFVDKGFPTRPKVNWEDVEWELSKSLARSTLLRALSLYNNNPTPIQIAATVSACEFPTLKKYVLLLKQVLEQL